MAARLNQNRFNSPLLYYVTPVTFMVILMLGFMIIFFAGLNFIRNYVIYV